MLISYEKRVRLLLILLNLPGIKRRKYVSLLKVSTEGNSALLFYGHKNKSGCLKQDCCRTPATIELTPYKLPAKTE
jgi:hypothetical protein